MAANEDLGILGQFFDWAGDIFTDEEKAEFTKQVMSRRGHKPVMNWADDDKNGGNQRSGNVLGIGTGKKAASGGGPGWQYGS